MTKKLYFLLVVVLASGMLAIGCGDDDDDDGGNGGGAAATTQEESGGGGGGGGSTDSDAAKAAKEGCEAGIKNNAALDASKRDDLSKECQKVADAAATGDSSKYKAAYSDYCNKLADALPAQAREAAKNACQQSVDAIPE